MDDYKIGTLEWWREDYIHGQKGIHHVILCMVFDHKISPRKGVELLEALEHRGQATEVPPAPWDEFFW